MSSFYSGNIFMSSALYCSYRWSPVVGKFQIWKVFLIGQKRLLNGTIKSFVWTQTFIILFCEAHSLNTVLLVLIITCLGGQFKINCPSAFLKIFTISKFSKLTRVIYPKNRPNQTCDYWLITPNQQTNIF